LQGQIVIRAVENVTNQAAQVTQAVKNRQRELRKLSRALPMQENRYARLPQLSRNRQNRTGYYRICSKCQRTGGSCDNAVKEQTQGIEDIIRVLRMQESRCVSYHTVKEQAKQGQNIVTAVENVANQAAQITNATKEQAHGVEDIIKSVANAVNR